MTFQTRALTEAELASLLAHDEGFHFDCKDKRKKPSALLQHVVGFANAHGGKLVVGLRDQKDAQGIARISGFVRPEEANDFTTIFAREVEPPVRGLRFAFLDTGIKDGPLLLEIEVPRSSRLHRAGGRAYLRENAATNPLDERRVELLAWEKRALRLVRALPAIVGVSLSLVALVFAYGWASEPQFSTKWVAYPTGVGLREEYELRLEIGQTLGEGIVDVHAQLDFPMPVAQVSIVNNGGCEQLEVVPHVLRALTPSGATERPSTTVEFRANRCAPQSKPLLRLVMDDSTVLTSESPLLPDDGQLRVTYSWKVPVLGYRAPMRPTVSQVLKAPSTQWHNYYIPTRNYPASISNPPYYDLDSKRGRVAAYIRREDYESLPPGSELAWIATPAARINLVYQNGLFKGSIHWLTCAAPVEVSSPPSFALVGDDNPYRSIILSWENCTANIEFAGARKDADGHFISERR